MHQTELLLVGLLIGVVGLSALARRLSIPYPVLLVLGGAVVGFAPGMPQVKLNPEIVLVVFLPPLLYGQSIFTNFGDFRTDMRALSLNTVGLVLATMGVVAVVAHTAMSGVSWPAAFVLGAIVSPTDALAAAGIMRRLDTPRRLVSAIEGEGLFNDATALVAYRVALAAAVAGTFSLAHAGVKFIVDAAGGVAIGLAVGWLADQIRGRTIDARLSVTMSLITGYVAYAPADILGASGVLATVACGIYMGIRAPQILPTGARLQGYFVWDIVDFVANATLFVLIGLQLRGTINGLSGYSAGTLAAYTTGTVLSVVGTRFLWLFTVPYLVRALDRRPGQRSRRLGTRWRLVLAWSGMRGAVSLAVALALPYTTHTGAAFPGRNLIVFLTFAVIFFTLVIQGLSLPTVIRRLGIRDEDADDNEELRARLIATKAALAEINALAHEDWTRDETVDRIRAYYEYRKRRLAARAGKIEDEGYEERSLAYQQMIARVLQAQRDALLRMRNEQKIPNEVMHRILRELDLEEARLEPPAQTPTDGDRASAPISS